MKRDDLVTINEAAEIKGVSRQAIHAAINDSRLEVVKVPSVKLMISLAALESYIPDQRLQATGKQRYSKSS